MERSREYQKGNIDAVTGDVRTDESAGIALYSISSNQRATAKEAKRTEDIMQEAKKKGLLSRDAEVSADNLEKAGYSSNEAMKLADAYAQNKRGRDLLQDETVLAGFGNNGGEEFLSYMMTSESLVITGGKDWDEWHSKMSRRLDKIQNSDGGWSGQHCITSGVFCTSAVIMTLTADRDLQILLTEQQKNKESNF